MRCVFSLSQPPHSSTTVRLNRCHRHRVTRAFHGCRFPSRMLSNRLGEIGFVFSRAPGNSEVHSVLLRDYKAEWGGIHGSHDNLTGWSPWSFVMWCLRSQGRDSVIIYYIYMYYVTPFSSFVFNIFLMIKLIICLFYHSVILNAFLFTMTY